LTGKAAKVEAVAALRAKFEVTKGVILSDYRGLNVQQMAELRGRLREAAVDLHVVKNTLARRATEETAFAPLMGYFVGPTSIAFTDHDVVAMAKALTGYAKDQPKLEVRVGLVQGQVLSPTQITALAELPPREVLLARLLASMQSPLVGLVGVLRGVQRHLLYALLAIKTAKEEQTSVMGEEGNVVLSAEESKG
jgi:large subunit ribosomal protein L10